MRCPFCGMGVDAIWVGEGDPGFAVAHHSCVETAKDCLGELDAVADAVGWVDDTTDDPAESVRNLIAERDRLRAQLSALAEAALVVWGQRYDYDLDEAEGELPPMPEGWGCPVAVDLGDLAKLQALAAEVTRG